MDAFPVVPGIKVDVVRVLSRVVLLVLERIRASDQEDRILAAHLADLSGIDELAALDLHVLRPGRGLPVRFAKRGLMDGLVADHVTEVVDTVQLLGGDLNISWERDENLIYMTGPATTVFDGEIDLGFLGE